MSTNISVPKRLGEPGSGLVGQVLVQRKPWLASLQAAYHSRAWAEHIYQCDRAWFLRASAASLDLWIACMQETVQEAANRHYLYLYYWAHAFIHPVHLGNRKVVYSGHIDTAALREWRQGGGKLVYPYVDTAVIADQKRRVKSNKRYIDIEGVS